jgi:hypothetical protein
MKKLIKTLTVLTVLALFTTSCSEKEDYTGASNVDYSPATVTLSSLSPNVFDESAIDTDNESTYQITIVATLDSPQPVDAVIDLAQVGGSAGASDFDINGGIRIKAGQTSASATVDILKTGDIEGEETLFIGATSKANFNLIPFSHSVTITNDHINDVLDLTMDWAGSYSYTAGGGSLDVTVDYCSADFDLLLYTAAGSYVQYILGTASCPEEDQLSGLADGSYFLVVDLYGNPFSVLNTGQPMPITLTVNQEHFPDTGTTIVHNGYTTDSSSGLQAVATLDVVGGYNYTITPL